MAVHLTGGEWNVLSCLWERSPQTVMELVAELGRTVGWAKSTTITTLRRMEEAVADAYDEVKRSRAKFRSALGADHGGPAPRSQSAPRRAMYDAEADEDEDE